MPQLVRALKLSKIIMGRLEKNMSAFWRIEMIYLGYASGEARSDIRRNRSERKWIVSAHDHVVALLN
jgi:hypothetical protein